MKLGAKWAPLRFLREAGGGTDVVARAELGGAAPRVLFTGPANFWRRPFTGP